MSLQGQHSFPQRRTYGPGFVTEAWCFHPGLKGEVMGVKASPIVKVKALEWQRDTAHAAFGMHYHINVDDCGAVLLEKHTSSWTLNSLWPSIEAARAGAQADYERRVLACLELETSGTLS